MLYVNTLPTLSHGQDALEYCDNRGRKLVASVPLTSGGEEPAQNVGDYETVAASQTDQSLGATGAVGDFLKRLICVVATAATSTVSIKDGNGSAISILPANTAVGTYSIEIEMKAVNATTPGWKVTTGAGVSVIGVGSFT